MNKCIIIFFVLVFDHSFSQDKQQFKRGSFHNLQYRILWPEDFDTSKKYPLVLFLHGAGERGSDNEKQLTHGSELFLNDQSKHKSIILFPQCPTDDYWSNVEVVKNEMGGRSFLFKTEGEPTLSMQRAIDLMDSLVQKPFVDNSRCYVGGLSMGGMGTFEIINRKPKMFAAALPICGGAHPATAKNFAKEVSLWVFHGLKDNVVPSKYSNNMVEAIKKEGGQVKYTLFAEANHNSWDSAFAQPDLLKWLFSQKKK